MTIHFRHRVGKYTSSTESPVDFCAVIVPLQLGVVLIFFQINIKRWKILENLQRQYFCTSVDISNAKALNVFSLLTFLTPLHHFLVQSASICRPILCSPIALQTTCRSFVWGFRKRHNGPTLFSKLVFFCAITRFLYPEISLDSWTANLHFHLGVVAFSIPSGRHLCFVFFTFVDVFWHFDFE